MAVRNHNYNNEERIRKESMQQRKKKADKEKEATETDNQDFLEAWLYSKRVSRSTECGSRDT